MINRHPLSQRISDIEKPFRCGSLQHRIQFRWNHLLFAGLIQSVDSHLQPPQALLKGLLEGAAYGHGLSHGFHGYCEGIISTREFLKCKARDFDHTVVNRRFKRGRGLSGDVIGDLIQVVSHCKLGRDLCNGKSGCLGRQSRRPGNTGVHLNNHHAPCLRMNGKLYIRPSRGNADFPDHGNGGISHFLVLPVRKGLDRSHRDRIPGVDPHRVKVLYGADNDHVVILIAHDLKFKFFPSNDGLFYKDFICPALLYSYGCLILELLHVVRKRTSCSTECETGTDYGRKPDGPYDLSGFF